MDGKSNYLSCDIFCKVIDNFGDAGFSLRLASQLAAITQWRISLYIDDHELVRKLAPVTSMNASGFKIAHSNFASFDNQQVVIETFGCGFPGDYQDKLIECENWPIWIDVHYLSAEKWTDELHLGGSPHPRNGKPRYIYFPGFSDRTGGLIFKDVKAYVTDQEIRDRNLRIAREINVDLDRTNNELLVLLFCYPTSPIDSLIDGLKLSGRRVRILAAAGVDIGERPHDGNVSVHEIPFVSQETFDDLLSVCDWNFVRGEDSFVRAQWQANLFIWQAYRQNEDHHRVKIDAFLDRYLEGMEQPVRNAVRELTLAWNGFLPLTNACVKSVLDFHAVIVDHNKMWSAKLKRNGDLGTKLVEFILSKLQ